MNDLSATERCVKCGLCLPYCPTFNLTGNEADSPRGRISLMQLLDRPATEWSPGVFIHLDQCLLCHACEAMCPSRVPFDRLMDSARERLESHRRHAWRHRLAQAARLGMLTSKTGRRISAALLISARLLHLQRLARVRSLPAGWKRLLQLLPTPRGRGLPAKCLRQETAPEQDREPARAPFADRPAGAGGDVTPPNRGEVQLFTGCTGELFDADTLQASRRLLQRLGYRVAAPPDQGCCGALHQHSGRPDKARQLAEANLRAFTGDRRPVLTFASGCTAQLLGYAERYPQAREFAGRVSDIIDFLHTDAGHRLRFNPLAETVALYIPCTQRNILRQQATLISLLARIPRLQTVVVNPDGGCCGAAGSYMLTQPDLSGRLAEAMVDRIIGSGARLLLTTNIGCSLQLAAGLRKRGADITVMHPVVLLDALLVTPDA